jgi:hypothetical protein
MSAFAAWEPFAGEIAAIACVAPETIQRDRPVFEDGLLDSLALSELCVFVHAQSGVDLLDAHGAYRFTGMTWEGLHEMVNPDTAFLRVSLTPGQT